VHRFNLLVIIVAVVGSFGLSAITSSSQEAIKRQPLRKPGFHLKSPAVYEKRIRVRSGKEVTYDPKPRVAVADARTGKYALKWIGYDGREKVVIYQRPDAIDVVVTGAVENSTDEKYVYNYTVDILPSSGTYLYSFALQNFSADTRPIEVNGLAPTLAGNLVLIGEMSHLIQRYKDGHWIAFGTLPELERTVGPGGKLRIKISSNAAPGLVECTAVAGSRTMKGAGEHMPQELEDVLPGYDVWPSGYTVGPVASLNSLPQSARVTYIVDRMPRFETLGWITPAARAWYEKNLKPDVPSAQKRARRDLESQQISAEVFAMIQALPQ